MGEKKINPQATEHSAIVGTALVFLGVAAELIGLFRYMRTRRALNELEEILVSA